MSPVLYAPLAAVECNLVSAERIATSRLPFSCLLILLSKTRGDRIMVTDEPDLITPFRNFKDAMIPSVVKTCLVPEEVV